MRTGIVNLSDVESSGTLCMSPLRYVGGCHKCPVFQRKLRELHKKYSEHGRIIEEARRMPCGPRFDEEWVEAKLWAMDLREEAKRIEEELKGRD